MKRLALVLAMLPACGGDDNVDLSGVYAVDVHLADAEGCDSAVAIADSPGTHIRFTEQEILGAPYYEWEWCAGADGASCEEYSGYSLYGQPIDGGWESTISLSSYSADECFVAAVRSTAVLEGDLMMIETRHHTGTFATDAAGCDPALAESADSMECVQLEVIEATAL